ncbi:hypothetical protein L218DRAFT_914507 [Marasmius fiardii PR-910]|nr:hypothetical protein L218DRAFT_914507 [Marasmius fiardii PR-910]
MSLEHRNQLPIVESKAEPAREQDVFVEDPQHDIQYKVLSWQFVALLMIAEIVSNGMLSLPSALAVVGIAPALVLIVFLGIFGLYTSKLLIDFKLNHPSVHNMGDAGLILGGHFVRELLAAGTMIFAIFGIGSELLSGQQALSVLSDNGLCSVHLVLLFSAVTFVLALPRTLGNLSWLGLFSVSLIFVASVVAMVGAGLNPVPGRAVKVASSSNFSQAFLAITNPVFAYAGEPFFYIRPICERNCNSRHPSPGHFMFFILISEMKRPEDAMKAAWCLQGSATLLYVVFSLVLYLYIGDTVASPAFLSLPPKWAKASFGIALGNFLIAGSLYSHTAAKLVFVRLFRGTPHMYNHTVRGWSVWVLLCFISVAIAFVLAVAVPIFSYLIGIAAALFAAWYTYGLAGFFWLHDTYHLRGGSTALRKQWFQTVLSVLIIVSGAFICVAGAYVSIKLIDEAYKQGLVGKPFTC